MNNCVYNKLLWIFAKSVFVPRGTCPHFLATGYRIRARENSIRPYPWFHSLFTLSLFCSAMSIPHASFSFLWIVAHPFSPHLAIRTSARTFPRRQPLCPWCRPAGYRNVFNRILSTRVCQSEREAPERRGLLWLKKITADNYRGWVRGQSWLKEGMWQPHSAHTSLTTAKFRRLSRRAAAASSGTVLKEQGHWTPAV